MFYLLIIHFIVHLQLANGNRTDLHKTLAPTTHSPNHHERGEAEGAAGAGAHRRQGDRAEEEEGGAPDGHDRRQAVAGENIYCTL